MTEQEQREAIVREAKEWLGTPYVHGARLKGIGADCTFVAQAYENAGLLPHIDIAPYSPQAHLHRYGGIYLRTIERFGHRTDDPKLGDMAVYWYGRDFSHAGIVVNPGWPQIIHGDVNAKCIVLAVGDQAALALAKKRIFMTLW